jgi:hypothetical protein
VVHDRDVSPGWEASHPWNDFFDMRVAVAIDKGETKNADVKAILSSGIWPEGGGADFDRAC